MSKIKTIALVIMLSLVCLATSAYAWPEAFLTGMVYYNGSQVTTYSVQSYNSSPINQVTYYTDFSGVFAFGSYSWWPVGTYNICILSGGHYYHATVVHEYIGQCHTVGEVTLIGSGHRLHPVDDER